MQNLCAVILAAGEGKRMKSDSPKVLSSVLFKPMLGWVLDSVASAKIANVCVVTGYQSEKVKSYLSSTGANFTVVFQEKQLGTAHAAKMARDFLASFAGSHVLVLSGDSPFIDKNTIEASYKFHLEQNSDATVISAKIAEPFGYGRILRDEETGGLQSIVEQKDASADVQKICEVNSGAYWFNVQALLAVIDQISNDNAQAEYYLPDALSLLKRDGKKISAFLAQASEIVLGANDCSQLHELNEIARKKILGNLRDSGVCIPFDDGVVIGPDVTIEPGSTILPGTILQGQSSVGKGCTIGPNCTLIDTSVGDGIALNAVYCANSYIRSGQKVEPFTSVLNNKNFFHRF